MSAMQRAKGQAGERELAALLRTITGLDVQRRVRQHVGDSDLLGLPGWAIEVKRHKEATHAVIESWWTQTVRQAGPHRPALFYREDRQPWRAVWSLNGTTDYAGTVEAAPELWWAMCGGQV